MMNRLPYASFAPSGEAFVDGVVFAESLGEVLPGGSGASDPEHSIDEETVVSGIATGLSGLSRQQGGNALEVLIGDGVAVHEPQLKLKRRHNAVGGG